MSNFTTMIEKKEVKKDELPKTPFVICFESGLIKEYYLMTKNNDCDLYILTSLENGFSYQCDVYTKEYILDNLKRNVWKLVHSKIVLEDI